MEINPLKKGYILKSRYIIDEVIGRGGSAFVYHAKKIIGDYTEDVLIKELCPKNMYDDLTRTDDGSITVANDKIFNVFLHNMKSEQHTHFALRKNGNPFVFDIHDIFSDNNTDLTAPRFLLGDDYLFINLLLKLGHVGNNAHQPVAVGKGGQGTDGLL